MEETLVLEDLQRLRDDLRGEIDKLRQHISSLEAKQPQIQHPSTSRPHGSTIKEVSYDPELTKRFDTNGVPKMRSEASKVEALSEENGKQIMLERAATPRLSAGMRIMPERAEAPTLSAEQQEIVQNIRMSVVTQRRMDIIPRYNDKIPDWSVAGLAGNLRSFASHPIFDTGMALVILLNAVMIGFEVEMTAHSDSVSAALAFTILGEFFSFIFLAELIVRLAAFKMDFFRDPHNAGWNYLDFGLVLLSLVDTLLLLVGYGSGETSVIFSAVKTIKMFRILRLFRVFRISRKLSEIAIMISESLNALIWAMVMLALIIYIGSLVIASTAGIWLESQLRHEGDNWLSLALKSDPTGDVYEVARRFGSLARTANTLLQIMLGGLDWGDVVDMSMATGALIPVMLYLFVAYTMLAVLNVITGVFVDNALENRKKQHQYQIDKAKESEEDLAEQLQCLFSLADVDGNGYLTQTELAAMLEIEELDAIFKMWGFQREDLFQLWTMMDADRDSQITFKEFFETVEKVRGHARSIDVKFLLAETGRRLEGL